MYVKGITRISPLQVPFSLSLSLSLSLSPPNLYPHRHTYMHMYTKSTYIHTRTSPTITVNIPHNFPIMDADKQLSVSQSFMVTCYYTIHRHLEHSWTKLVISESYIPKCSGKFFSHKMITNHQTKLVIPRGNVISCIVINLQNKSPHQQI